MASTRKGQPKPRKTAARRDGAVVDQDLVKALAHPLRVEILAILGERVASPNELSKELEEGLSQISYHVKVLKDFKCLEMVRTEPRRGAVEHYYKALVPAYIPSDKLKDIPKVAQRKMWADLMRDIFYDVETSIEAGTFDNRPDYYIGRQVENMDGQARKEADALANEFGEKFKQLGVDSALRRAEGKGDGESISTTAATLVFGSHFGKTLARPPKTKAKGKRKK